MHHVCVPTPLAVGSDFLLRRLAVVLFYRRDNLLRLGPIQNTGNPLRDGGACRVNQSLGKMHAVRERRGKKREVSTKEEGGEHKREG